MAFFFTWISFPKCTPNREILKKKSERVPYSFRASAWNSMWNISHRIILLVAQSSLLSDALPPLICIVRCIIPVMQVKAVHSPTCTFTSGRDLA